MKHVRGYSEFLGSFEESLRTGIIADTNILISASYDLDPSNTETVQFFDLLAESEVPIFCNVNVRSEFLEIHRRIIFTEALLDFEAQVDKTKIPKDLVSKLNSIRSQSEKRTKHAKAPLRLSEADIKDFKSKMSQICSGASDLWTALCEDRVGDKPASVWKETEDAFGINFLSMRKEDREQYFIKSPSWDDAMRLMESHGLSSSDAMIVNMFLCSKLRAIVTSDWEVASSLHKMADAAKLVFCPDVIAARF